MLVINMLKIFEGGIVASFCDMVEQLMCVRRWNIVGMKKDQAGKTIWTLIRILRSILKRT